MKTIRNNKLFETLVKGETQNEIWRRLIDGAEEENMLRLLPVLAGGLDHIDIKKKGVYFFDIGCNGRDNGFVIRPELEKKDGGSLLKVHPRTQVHNDMQPEFEQSETGIYISEGMYNTLLNQNCIALNWGGSAYRKNEQISARYVIIDIPEIGRLHDAVERTWEELITLPSGRTGILSCRSISDNILYRYLEIEK